MTNPNTLAAARQAVLAAKEVAEGMAMKANPRPGHGDYAAGWAKISRYVGPHWICKLSTALLAAEAECERLRGELAGKEWDITCPHCGWVYHYVRGDEDARRAALEAATAHDRQCSMHPAVQELAALRAALARREHPTAEPEE